MTEPEPLLTVQSVAIQLAVSTQTVRRMIKRGDLAGLRVGPRQFRIRPESFRAYLNEGQAPDDRSELPDP